MSCPSKARKAFSSNSKSKSKNNSNSSSSSSSNSSSCSSSAVGSKVGSICGKKADQILSSTANSSVGSSTTDLMCDVSDIEKPHIRNQTQCPKGQDKEAKKVVPKPKAMTFTEKSEIAYASYIQMLYFCSLQTRRIKSETEICFSDLEAEKLKLDNEISTVKRWLKEVSSLQESESRTEELEKMFMEVKDDTYQLQTMLKKVNLDMKIASGQVPLTVLKVTDASRDEFLSIIDELSNVRNEIISLMKPHEGGQKYAAQNLDSCVSTVVQLRSLIKDCCSSLPSVVSSYFRALSLQLCLMHQDQDSQLNKIGF
ncbi:uncharacterized protein LOC126456977 [Schistocerca serialis cubense]|uniref:uncharacterized protein LOC126456977 n=1 Tax=Schistocerca serialis cubense TaxID=2023355 RepID=UPI00214ED9A1|nr:uncharacterized protein LOC126456977 [Schistocerca serialis cubense]XP_049948879.1 uncharacterized protein LOC126456977 [Schistocerca serialis cubense]